MLVAREMELLINAVISEGLPSGYNPLLLVLSGLTNRRSGIAATSSVTRHSPGGTPRLSTAQIDVGMRFAAFDFVASDDGFEEPGELISI